MTVGYDVSEELKSTARLTLPRVTMQMVRSIYRQNPMLVRLLDAERARERLLAEAALESSGIEPPPEGFQIDRSPKDWWKTS